MANMWLSIVTTLLLSSFQVKSYSYGYYPQNPSYDYQPAVVLQQEIGADCPFHKEPITLTHPVDTAEGTIYQEGPYAFDQYPQNIYQNVPDFNNKYNPGYSQPQPSPYGPDAYQSPYYPSYPQQYQPYPQQYYDQAPQYIEHPQPYEYPTYQYYENPQVPNQNYPDQYQNYPVYENSYPQQFEYLQPEPYPSYSYVQQPYEQNSPPAVEGSSFNPDENLIEYYPSLQSPQINPQPFETSYPEEPVPNPEQQIFVVEQIQENDPGETQWLMDKSVADLEATHIAANEEISESETNMNRKVRAAKNNLGSKMVEAPAMVYGNNMEEIMEVREHAPRARSLTRFFSSFKTAQSNIIAPATKTVTDGLGKLAFWPVEVIPKVEMQKKTKAPKTTTEVSPTNTKNERLSQKEYEEYAKLLQSLMDKSENQKATTPNVKTVQNSIETTQTATTTPRVETVPNYNATTQKKNPSHNKSTPPTGTFVDKIRDNYYNPVSNKETPTAPPEKKKIVMEDEDVAAVSSPEKSEVIINKHVIKGARQDQPKQNNRNKTDEEINNSSTDGNKKITIKLVETRNQEKTNGVSTGLSNYVLSPVSGDKYMGNNELEKEIEHNGLKKEGGPEEFFTEGETTQVNPNQLQHEDKENNDVELEIVPKGESLRENSEEQKGHNYFVEDSIKEIERTSSIALQENETIEKSANGEKTEEKLPIEEIAEGGEINPVSDESMKDMGTKEIIDLPEDNNNYEIATVFNETPTQQEPHTAMSDSSLANILVEQNAPKNFEAAQDILEETHHEYNEGDEIEKGEVHYGQGLQKNQEISENENPNFHDVSEKETERQNNENLEEMTLSPSLENIFVPDQDEYNDCLIGCDERTRAAANANVNEGNQCIARVDSIRKAATAQVRNNEAAAYAAARDQNEVEREYLAICASSQFTLCKEERTKLQDTVVDFATNINGDLATLTDVEIEHANAVNQCLAVADAKHEAIRQNAREEVHACKTQDNVVYQ